MKLKAIMKLKYFEIALKELNLEQNKFLNLIFLRIRGV